MSQTLCTFTQFRSSRFSTDRFMTISLLQFCFVRSMVVSHGEFVLSMFVPKLFFCWCHGKAVLCDSGICWVSSLTFLLLANTAVFNYARFISITGKMILLNSCAYYTHFKLKTRRGNSKLEISVIVTFPGLSIFFQLAV